MREIFKRDVRRPCEDLLHIPVTKSVCKKKTVQKLSAAAVNGWEKSQKRSPKLGCNQDFLSKNSCNSSEVPLYFLFKNIKLILFDISVYAAAPVHEVRGALVPQSL
jgi:hypothetical protein